MTKENVPYLIVAVAIVVMVVVFLLRKQIFRIKATKRGFEIDSSPPKADPGIVAKDVTAETGNANLRNEEGTGVSAEDITAHKDVNITNTKSPNP